MPSSVRGLITVPAGASSARSAPPPFGAATIAVTAQLPQKTPTAPAHRHTGHLAEQAERCLRRLLATTRRHLALAFFAAGQPRPRSRIVPTNTISSGHSLSVRRSSQAVPIPRSCAHCGAGQPQDRQTARPTTRLQDTASLPERGGGGALGPREDPARAVDHLRRAVPHQRSGKTRVVWFTYDDIIAIGRMLPQLITGIQANRVKRRPTP